MRLRLHSNLYMNSIHDLAQSILQNDGFLVVSHVSPDGDTIGSGAALCYMLNKLGKSCIQRCDGDVPHNLAYFSELSEFMKKPYAGYSTVIAVDCADKVRLGRYSEQFEQAKLKIVIDHHKTNDGFGDINYICACPATAQCIFNLAEETGAGLDDNIAKCLYIAFLTDTGRFAYRDVSKETMAAAAELYSYNIDASEVNRRLFSVRSYNKTKLLGCALGNLETWYDGAVSAIFLDYAAYGQFCGDDCDTDGIVNYALDVEGCRMAIFAHEKEPGKTKISFRSVSVQDDVSLLAERLGGGGHTQAAGCTVDKPCSEAKTLIYSLLGEYLF